MTGRSVITEKERRIAFLKHCREAGFEDSRVRGGPQADRYQDDPEARATYLQGARLGLRERRRHG